MSKIFPNLPKQIPVFVLLAVLVATLALPVFAADDALVTHVSLLIGRPTADDGVEGVLVVPGTVIPIDGVLAYGDSEKARNDRLHRVAGSLKRSLRLSDVEVRYQMPVTLAIDEVRDLPAPASTSNVQVSVKLLGQNATTASYEVQFYEGSTPITDTAVTVHRGKQAVVGGLDGEDAPYLFLVISPVALAPVEGEAVGPLHVGGDIQPPLALEKIPPSYTEEARKEKIQGVVIVQTVIGTDGRISQVKVLKGLSHGLDEVAVDAIRKWRFEPALKDGKPVAVYYNLTVNFRLAKDKKE